MNKKTEQIFQEYYKLLAQQKFVEKELDYTILEKQKPLLDQIGMVSNSSITVFDLCKKKHVYVSANFDSSFGFDLEKAKAEEGTVYFDYKVHPDDLYDLTKNGIELLKFCFELKKEKIKDFKLINEYRIKNGFGKYIRVIEQHQVLELDSLGNIWLTLGVMDVSPSQNVNEPFKSRLFNYKTAELFNFPIKESKTEIPSLSKREIQILNLLGEGYISKEIADKLFISSHTVNTHRQRIISKLKVSNTIEAVNFATRLGLLD